MVVVVVEVVVLVVVVAVGGGGGGGGSAGGGGGGSAGGGETSQECVDLSKTQTEQVASMVERLAETMQKQVPLRGTGRIQHGAGVEWKREFTQGEDRTTQCLQKCLRGGFKDTHVQLGLTMFAVYFRHFEHFGSAMGHIGQTEGFVKVMVGRSFLEADGLRLHRQNLKCWKVLSMEARSILSSRMCSSLAALW
eukprot:s1803_g20.t1